MSPQSITCVGIGNMGSALAHTLLKANTHITVWNRTKDRPLVASVTEAGAKFESSIVEAVSKSDVVLICVVDYPALYQAFEPLASASALAGKVIVNITNGTPREAREAEEFMKTRGADRYFDGAIMVVPQMVGTPHSFLIISGGDEESFQAPKELLEPLGKILYVSPDVDAAAAQDLAALSTMYGMFTGAFSGFALLKRTTKAKDAAIGPAVQNVIIPTITPLVPYLHLIAESMDKKTEGDSLGNPLSMQLAGLGNITTGCKQEGVNVRPLEAFAALMQKAVDDGWGDGGVAAVGRYFLE
jgi:3-hydroxyisobutyrate dehydrogenase-like beta-hydroxyacid dehydrogenase